MATEGTHLVNDNAPDPPKQGDVESQPGDDPVVYSSGTWGTIQKANDDASSHTDFCCRVVVNVCCGTCNFVIYIAFMLVVPLAEVIIASVFFNDCPRQKYIPIFFLVFGLFGLLKAGAAIASKAAKKFCKKPDSEEPEEEVDHVKKGRPNLILLVLILFLVAWYICGTIWTFGIVDDYQSTDSNKPKYCNRTLYLFAFLDLTIRHIILIVTIICTLCLCCIRICKGKPIRGNKKGKKK